MNSSSIDFGRTDRPRLIVFMPAPANTTPSQRFRWEMWTPLLQEVVDVETVFIHSSDAGSFSGTFGKRLMDYRSAIRYIRSGVLRGAHVVIQRRLGRLGWPFLEKAVLNAGCRAVYFDLDDAVFISVLASRSRVKTFVKRCLNYTKFLMRNTDLSFCGNEWLADNVRAVGRPAIVAPTTVELQECKQQRDSGPLVIGWSGSKTTVRYIQELLPQLEKLRHNFDFKLLVIGGSVSSSSIDVECRPWRAQTEYDDIRSIDIGLMPLPHFEWSKGKCALKALQYMSHGIPTVASDFGANRDVITPGESGLLASETDWCEQLASLLQSSDLRHRLGGAGHEVVRARYTPAAVVPTILGTLNEYDRKD
ncbi:MAG: glycosyltransferase [Fuerstiella sp.]|nr:glycosyltransferase [Fuerstiella sp.]